MNQPILHTSCLLHPLKSLIPHYVSDTERDTGTNYIGGRGARTASAFPTLTRDRQNWDGT